MLHLVLFQIPLLFYQVPFYHIHLKNYDFWSPRSVKMARTCLNSPQSTDMVIDVSILTRLILILYSSFSCVKYSLEMLKLLKLDFHELPCSQLDKFQKRSEDRKERKAIFLLLFQLVMSNVLRPENLEMVGKAVSIILEFSYQIPRGRILAVAWELMAGASRPPHCIYEGRSFNSVHWLTSEASSSLY